MDAIQLRATFPNIASDNLAEFTSLAHEAVTAVRGESGALQYDWFFNEDQTKCVVLEKYESSEAVLAHLANSGALIGKLAVLAGGLELDVFGNLSPELRKALAKPARAVYPYFVGL